MLFSALAIASASANAETMYRCVGKGGAVAYQDYPCDKAAKQTGVAEFTPERVPAYRPPVRNIPQQAGSAASPSAAVLHHVPVYSDQCREVKAQRDAWEQRVGLRRTFDDLRRWQDKVNEACK